MKLMPLFSRFWPTRIAKFYFEPSWYLETYKDVKNARARPWRHFVIWGDREFRKPGPYFDPDFYISTRQDAFVGDVRKPFTHYVCRGVGEGRSPNPYFDPAWYAAQLNGAVPPGDLFMHYACDGWKLGLNPSQYFDAQWYISTNVDVQESGIEPLRHYIEFGYHEGRKPNIYFNPGYYLAANPDVAEAGTEPLGHYVRCGWHEVCRTFTPLFDKNWYLAQLGGEVPVGDPFLHYVEQGWKSGFSPSPYFDLNWYLLINPDVRQAGIEPLRHYIEFGYREGRKPNPYFDPAYYLAANTDVAQADAEPLSHYVQFGWCERGRQPNRFFDKDWYKKNRMPEDSKEDPLRHFILHGAANCWSPSPEFDWDYYLKQSVEVDQKSNAYAHFLEVGQLMGRRANPRAQSQPNRADLMAWAYANGFRDDGYDTGARQDVSERTARKAVESSLGRLLGYADVISFDVFDTLVQRSCGLPDAVFDLVALRAPNLGYVQGDFAAMRKQAETQARLQNGQQEVRLTEIYEEFREATGCSESVCSALLTAEIEEELAVCEPKAIGRILFDYAVRSRRPIIVVTDIYLPQTIVEMILEKCGYTAPCRLFVSSELGSTKHSGSLFALVIKETGAAPDRIVHIGDNLHSDGEMARSNGLRTLLVPRSAPARVETDAKDPPQRRSSRLWSDVLAAEIDLRVSRASLERQGSRRSEDLATVGTRVFGPLLLGFALFVAKRAAAAGYDRLYFASRDAFYLREAYEIVRRRLPKLPASRYFFASRKVCRFAMIQTVDDIAALAAIDHYPMPVHRFLSARFMQDPSHGPAERRVSADELNHVVKSSRDDPTLAKVLRAYEPEIMAAAAAHSEAYRAYLAEIGLFQGHCAVVDIGYRGTIQRSLTRLVGRRLGGIYLMVWPDADRLLDEGLRFDAYLRQEKNGTDIINRNLAVMELLLSGTHASIDLFGLVDGRPRPRYLPIDTTSSTRRTLNTLRASALAFVEEMCERYASQLSAMTVDSGFAFDPLREALLSPPVRLADGLTQHVVEDDFGGDSRLLVVPPRDEAGFRETLVSSCWKEGTSSLWRAHRHGWVNLPPEPGDGEVPTDFFDGFECRPSYVDNSW